MQPDQPQTPLQSYDFILNPQKPSGKSKLPLSLPGPGSSLAMRLLYLAGGAIVLLLLISFAVSTIFGGTDITTDITGVAAAQTEISRVIGLSDQKIQSPDVSAFSASTGLVITSSKTDLLAGAKTAGFKINEKQLLARKDSTVDTTLATAASSGQFDQVYMKLLITDLTAYQQQMAALYPKVKDQKLKATLDSAYTSVKQLLASQKTTSQ